MTGQIRFRVYGEPVPQGSSRAFAIRKGGVPTGAVAVTAANKRTKPWRQAIVDEVTGVLDSEEGHAWPAMTEAPVRVRLMFILPRPASHYGTGRNNARVKPSAPVWPHKKPDLDKLTRAALDALTDAGAWRDDAQVVALAAWKRYVTRKDERPGVVIVLELEHAGG